MLRDHRKFLNENPPQLFIKKRMWMKMEKLDW